MKVKTSELTGAALDWAVAKCEGHSLPPFPGRGQTRGPKQRWINVSPSSHETFSPSTEWAHGGPIIEREKTATMYWTGKREWAAKPDSKKSNEPNHFGPTTLIAAMRCYVASKLGDEVDVPDELV